MNKKLISALLLFCCAGAIAEELKVTTLDKKRIDYENGIMGGTMFRVVCINGYKWLQYHGEHGSMSQMFESTANNGLAKPIKCEN